ncbi:MAG: serine protein kinase RIO [Sulfolobales archaeon]
MYYKATGKVRKELDKDLFETVEEVFDSATLLAIIELSRRKVLYELKGVVSSGKESRIYWGKSFSNEDLAVKIYLTSSAEFRKGMLKYLAGDPRFKKIPKSTRKLVSTWARKEFKNLKLMYDVGARVPKPIAQYENVLIMEFIGEEGVRAPLLKEVELELHDYEVIFYKILEDVRKIYRYAGLVHGDLSEYNVMVYKGVPYIIDVSQSVKITHPNAYNLLVRDLSNLVNFFRGLGLNTPDLDELIDYVSSGGNVDLDEF